MDFHLGATSIVLRVVILDSTVATGAGKTGLTSASSGLNVSAIADNEATATAYTAAGSLIDTIATLGTYAAPTATHCRFKEVDATNLPGLYELQLENSRYAVSNAKSLVIFITGATGAAPCRVCVPLRTVDPYNANFGLTGLTGLTAPTGGALPTVGSGTGQINPSGGKVPATIASSDYAGNTPQTGDNFARLGAPVGASISADIQTRSTYAGGAVASVTAPVTAGTVTDKTGYALSGTQSFNNTGQTSNLPADLQTIKTQAVTCSAGVTINPFVGTATAALVVNGSGFVTVVTSNDKAGYSLTQTFPTNFSALAITSAGVVSANTTKWAGQGVQLDASNRPQVVVFPGSAADLGTSNSLGRLLWLLMPNDGSSDTGTLPDQTGMTTSQIKLASTSNTANVRNGYVFTPTSGLQTKGRKITSFDSTTKIVTVNNAWTTNPATGDTYRIDPPPSENVSGYTLLNSPDYYVLATPGQTIATDTSHNVTIDPAILDGIWSLSGAPTINDGVVQANVVEVLGVAAEIEVIPTAAQNAAAVLDVAASGHNIAGTIGAKINASGAGGDPMATDVATGYTGTQAGAIIKALDLNNVLTWRDQDDNATPNGHDARFAAWFAAFGHEGDPNPDGTIPGLAPDDTTIFTYDEAPGVTVAPNGLDLVIVEPTAGINMRQAMQGLLADSAGTLAGAGTGTIVINGANTAVPRIIATTDSLGNRLQVSFLFDV